MAAATLVLVTFAAGGVVGSVISDAWGDSARPQSEGDRDRNEGRRRPYSERLGDELNLDPVQRESVSVILQNRQDGLSQIWSETQPRFDSLRLDIREDIKDMLTDEQQGAFQEIIDRSDSSRAARESRENGDNERDGGRRHDHDL